MAVLSHFKFWTNNLIAYRIAKEVNGMARHEYEQSSPMITNYTT